MARPLAIWLGTAAAALAGALLAASCTEPRSAACRDVCSREADCHEELDSPQNFDEGECLDACAALERDERTQIVVEQHVACVREASGCSQVIDCP